MNERDLIWNPCRKGYMENPYELLRQWREKNPVHKGINGCWVLFKYDDVKLFLTSPGFKMWQTPRVVATKSRLLNNSENFDTLSGVLSKILLFLDPPEHTHLRSIISKIWNSYVLREEIRAVVEETLDCLADKKEVDIVADFAGLIPTRLICRILGLPVEDLPKIKKWSYQLIQVLEPFNSLYRLREFNEFAGEFHAYMTQVIREKERRPDDAFISRLLAVNEKSSEPLSHDDMISIMCLLFFAGIETSVNLFSQSVLLLIKNPEQAALARESEYLEPQAVNELVRFVTPTQYTKRITEKDIEIRGEKIKAGESVLGSLVSANFDTDVFENPERLDLERVKNPHLSFGHGLHYCLGAKLSREEMSISIPAFFRRFPNVALQTGKNYQWDTLIMNRTLKTLPVVLN